MGVVSLLWTMVGADEEMSVTVVRWKFGEERLKNDLEKEEAAVAEPEGAPEGEPQGKEGIDAEIKKDILGLKGMINRRKEKPDFLALMLERVIDTILLEEVASLGTKMNRYRSVLAEGILAFAEGHQEDRADLSRLVEAFRQGWKVYRVNEHVKATLDTFMEAMNNQLWQPDSASTPDVLSDQS